MLLFEDRSFRILVVERLRRATVYLGDLPLKVIPLFGLYKSFVN